MKLARTLGLGAFALVGAGANAALFDFESEAYSTTVRGFSMTDSGITATFLDPGSDSWIVDLGTSAPAGWLSHTFLPAVFATNHQVVDFSTLISYAQIEGGDFFADDDELHIRAWSGAGATGSVVASFDGSYSASMGVPGDVITGSVAFSGGFASIEFWEDGATGSNDFYTDNLVVRAVPEPATLVALGGGLAAMLRRRRK